MFPTRQLKHLVAIPLAWSALAFQPDPAILRNVYEEALARREREYGSKDPRTAQAARDLGFYLKGIGNQKSAVTALSKVVQIDEANYGPDARQTLADVAGLASVSPPHEAQTLLRRAITAKDPQIAGPALATLGDLRLAAGDRPGAAAYWRQALQQAEAAYGKEGVVVEMILNSLSQAVSPEEAVQLLERALEISRAGWGERHPETATTEVNLSRALVNAGRIADAIDAAKQGLAGYIATLGPLHPRTAAAFHTLGDALLKNGDPRGAEEQYRQSLEIDRQALGPKDKQTVADARSLTALLRRGGRTRQALELEREFQIAPRR